MSPGRSGARWRSTVMRDTSTSTKKARSAATSRTGDGTRVRPHVFNWSNEPAGMAARSYRGADVSTRERRRRGPAPRAASATEANERHDRDDPQQPERGATARCDDRRDGDDQEENRQETPRH